MDLGESFPTHIYLQNFVSIQPRTSPPEKNREKAGTVRYDYHLHVGAYRICDKLSIPKHLFAAVRGEVEVEMAALPRSDRAYVFLTPSENIFFPTSNFFLICFLTF